MATKKSDDLNRTLARSFAWGATPPAEPTGDSPPPAAAPPKAPAITDAELQALREKARREAAILADRIDHVWSQPEGERPKAVSALFERVGEMGALVAALQLYPQANMRLLRLAFEHWERLAKPARIGAGFASVYCDLTQPETIDLIADAVRATPPTFAWFVYLAVLADADASAIFARSERAGVRFARLLAQAETWEERRLAIAWIGVSPHRDAILPLRRALTLPHFVLRWEALTVLDKHFPEAIAPDDVRALLEDSVEHPPLFKENDQANADAHRHFPALLGKLIGAHRPEGAPALLLRLVKFDYRTVYRPCPSTDEIWAIGVLAAHYPEFAQEMVDRGARSIDRYQRRDAIEGLVHLPEDLAWPRLLAAAADPIPKLAKRAKDIWLSRRGTPCPVDELAGIQVELLDGPPSDRMRSRVELLRQAPREARAVIVKMLYKEAPSPEALVCLLFAVGDSRLWGKSAHGLPRAFDEVARELVERFGERALLGLTNLAARYDADNTGMVRGDGSYPEAGILAALAKLWGEGVDFPAAAHAQMLDLAARQLALDTPTAPDEALVILARFGAPPALAPRLAALAWNPAPKHRDGERMAVRARGLASFALALTAPEDEAIDTMILDEMRAARAAGDLPRFALASATGTVRGLVDAIEQTEDVVRAHGPLPEGDLAITDALEACTMQLVAGEDLPPTWIDDGLKSKGTHAFVVAARACRKREKLPETTRAALDAALDVDGQAAAGAAEAALSLLHAKAIDASDPRLYGVAERAPLVLRAELVGKLLVTRDARELWPLIVEILATTDARVAQAFQLAMLMLEMAGMGDEVRALSGRIPRKELQRRIDALDDDDGGSFWVDGPPELEEPTEAEREAASARLMARIDAMLANRKP